MIVNSACVVHPFHVVCVRQRDIREHVDGEYAVQTQDQAALLEI